MSREVEQKVVEMRFDNKNFEQNVGATLRSLDKLKEGLNFKGAANSFAEVEQASAKVKFDGMTKAVDHINSRFSALGIMSMNVLNRMSNAAINTGNRILHALAIDPIKQGFSEYELKMGSIQTIMAGTGESLKTVSGYLDELNHYSDKTIYSFSDMTNNIGKFTNAGVKLKDAVAAIQGISNEAALSGANAEQASHAMYNFAQALSAGHVKLIDWKSIEVANMATVEFKNELIKTAVATGTLTKKGDKYISTTKNAKGAVSDAFNATKGFNDSLSNQWMTTEVLTKTLAKYADETTDIGKRATKAATEIKTFHMLVDTLKEAAGSGWAQTWETVFGNFDEGVKLWTGMNDVIGGAIGAMADFRNANADAWKEAGGRIALVNALDNAFKGLTSVIRPIKDAFKEILPPATGQQWAWFSKVIESVSQKMVLTKEKSAQLKNTFAGLFTVLKVVIQNFKIGITILTPFLKIISLIASGILRLTGYIGGLIANSRLLNGYISVTNEIVSKAKDKMLEWGKTLRAYYIVLLLILQKAKDYCVEFGHSIMDIYHSLKESFGPVIEDISNTFSKWKNAIVETYKEMDPFGKLCDKIVKVLKNGLDGVKAFFEAVKEKIDTTHLEKAGKAVEKVDKAVTNVTSSVKKSAEEAKTTKDKILAWLEAVQAKFEKLGQRIKNSNLYQSMANGFMLVKNTTRSLTGIIHGFVKSIDILVSKLDLGKVLDAINTAAVGTVALSIADFIRSVAKSGKELVSVVQGIKDSMDNIVDIFEGVKGCLKEYQKSLKADVLKKIAGAILELAGAILIISLIDKDKLMAATGAITMMFINLMGSMQSLGALDVTGLKRIGTAVTMIRTLSGAVVKLSVAVFIIAEALNTLGQIDTKHMITAVAGLGSAIFLLCRIMKSTAKYTKDALIAAPQVVLLSGAMLIMAGALRMLKDISFKDVILGLTSMLGMVKVMGKLGKLSSMHFNHEELIGISKSIVILAGALGIMGISLRLFNKVNWSSIFKGVVALKGVVIAAEELAVITKYIGDFREASKSIGILAIALGALAGALYLYQYVDWVSMGKGALALAGLSAIVDGFLFFVDDYNNLLKASEALVIFSSSVAILAGALVAFNYVDWESLGKAAAAFVGLEVMVGVFAGFSKKYGDIIKTSEALVIFTACVAGLAGAIKLFDFVELESMGKAALALFGFLTMVGGFAAIAEKAGGDMIKTSSAMVICASAVAFLTASLTILSKADPEGLLNSAMALVGIMGGIAIALKIADNSVAGAGAIAAVAAALNLLTVPIILLGSMKWQVLVGGMGTLAVGLAAIAAAAHFCQMALPGLLGLAGAIAAVGVAAFGIGAGLGLATAGIGALIAACGALLASLGALVTMVSASGAGILVVVADVVKVILESAISVIPTLAKHVADGLVNMVATIASYADTIAKAVVLILQAILKLIDGIIPPLIKVVAHIIEVVLAALVKLTPVIVKAAFDILIACLKGIRDGIGEVTKVAIEIILEFVKAIGEMIPVVIQAGFDLLIAFIDGITDSIAKNTTRLIESVTDLFAEVIVAAIHVLTGNLTLFKKVGERLMRDYFGKGVKDQKGGLISSLGNIITGMIDSLNKSYNEFKEKAKYLIDGFIGGLDEKKQSVINRIKNLGHEIVAALKLVLGIHSPSTVTKSIARFFGLGFINEMKTVTKNAYDSALTMGNAAKNGLEKAINDADTIYSVHPVFNSDDIPDTVPVKVGATMSMPYRASDMASRIDRNIIASKATMDDSDISKLADKINAKGSNTVTNNNTFNIYTNDPEAAADAVEARLQNDVERKDAVWDG